MKCQIRNSFADLIRRAAAATTATAMLFGPVGSVFANRAESENAVRHIQHVIIIYQENWSFDSLYGQFPGASGYAFGFDTLPQYDVHASPPYSALIYKAPRPLTGFPLAADPQFPASTDGNLG